MNYARVDSIHAALPKYVIIDLSAAYKLLSDLAAQECMPSMDTEAIMSVILEALFKPYVHQSSTALTCGYNVAIELMDQVGDSTLETLAHFKIQTAVQEIMQLCWRELQAKQLYYENQLVYDYAYRRNARHALLIRKQGVYT